MKKILVWFFVLIFSFITFSYIPPKAFAATINVSPGDDVQAAVAAANDGDIILFAPGTYDEATTINPTVDNLTLRGSGAAVTTISSDVNAFTINTDVKNLTIEGFTITSVGGDDGIYCQVLAPEEPATGTIVNNIITSNQVDVNLDGIYLEGGCGFNIDNNTINYNLVAGIYIEDPTILSNIHTNRITNNLYGIINDSSDILNPANISIYNNNINENFAGVMLDTANASIYGNSIYGNIGPTIGASGLTALGGSVQIYSNKIYQNTNIMGGGLFVIGIDPGSNIYNNYISGNSSTVTTGGGLVSAINNAPMFNNTIVNNTAAGGDFEFNDQAIETIQFNGERGLAFQEWLNSFETRFEDKLAEANQINNYFYAGSGNVGGGVLIDHGPAPAPAFYNNIVWGNTDDIYDVAGDLSVTYSDVEEGYAGTGNIQSDPKLTGYVLGSDSPCIDAGTSTGAPAYDIDSITRPQRNGIDIGAYELPNPEAVATLPATGLTNQNVFVKISAFLSSVWQRFIH